MPDGQASVSGRTLRVSILALLKSVLDFNSGSNGSFNHSTDKRDPGLRLGWMKVPPGDQKIFRSSSLHRKIRSIFSSRQRAAKTQ